MQNKVLSTFGIRVITVLFNFLFTIAVSRYLGAEGKGEASIIVASVVVILIFCDVIGGASIVYFVPRFSNLKLFFISSCWSLIVCVITYIFFSTTSFFVGASINHIIIIAFISSVFATNLNILLGKNKIDAYNILTLLKTVIHVVIFMLLIYCFNKRDVNSYIYSYYTALATCIIISIILVAPYFNKHTVNSTSKRLIPELARLGLHNQASHIMKFLSVRLCFYLIVYYSGNTALGVFSNGVALVEVLLIITNSFTGILYARVVNTNNKKEAQQLAIHYNKISLIVCIIAIIPMVLLPSSFYSWLLGPEFKNVKEVIVIQIPGIFLYNTALIFGHYFSGIGKNHINTIGNFISLLVVIIMSLLILPHYTNVWASIISCCSYIVTSVIAVYYFKKEANIHLKQLLPETSDLKYIIQQAKSTLNRFIY